ncbi:MAG: TolC family protein [Flammeovirgaceae bacterium]
MSKLSYYLLISIIFSANWKAQAQTEPWTYQDCIAYAHEHNMQMKENQFAKRSAELDIYYAKKAFVPTITMGTSVNVGLGRTIDPFSNQFTTEPVISNSWNVNASLPIFQGFRLHADLEKAKISLENNQLSTQKASRDLDIQIANAYLQILFNAEQLKSSQKQLQLSQAQVERTEKLIQAGRLPQSNIYELQVQVTNAEVQVVNGKNNLLVSKLQLKQLLGLPAEQAFAVSYPTIAEPDSTFLLLSYEQIFDLTRIQPETQLNALAVRQAEIDYRQAKRAYLPNLSISYGVGTGYSSQSRNFVPGEGEVQTVLSPIGFVSPDGGQTRGDIVYQESFIGPNPVPVTVPLQDQFKNNVNQSTNLNVRIPFLSAATSLKQGLRNTRLAVERARMKAENDQNQLKQTLFQKFTEAQAAFQTYRINQKKQKIQQVAFSQAESKYQKGQINSFEYTTAKNSLWMSENELLRSKYDAVLKIKILRFYMGEELSF